MLQVLQVLQEWSSADSEDLRNKWQERQMGEETYVSWTSADSMVLPVFQAKHRETFFDMPFAQGKVAHVVRVSCHTTLATRINLIAQHTLLCVLKRIYPANLTRYNGCDRITRDTQISS